MSKKTRACALSVAGFDPSGGAGVLADIKTFEQFGVTGFGAVSALTYQSDRSFEGLRWISIQEIVEQLRPLSSRFSVEWIKIGLIRNLSVLLDLLSELKALWPNSRVVWDPILNASAGYVFHAEIDRDLLERVCRRVFLITPNIPELEVLAVGDTVKQKSDWLSQWSHLLVKGGHKSGATVQDVLYSSDGTVVFEGERIEGPGKHGSGCVLSSAITAALASGMDLSESCAAGRKYVGKFLRSDPSLLGSHAGLKI